MQSAVSRYSARQRGINSCVLFVILGCELFSRSFKGFIQDIFDFVGLFAGRRSLLDRQFRNISQKLGQDAFATQVANRDILNVSAVFSDFQFFKCLLVYLI